jgi:hypothetical protein
MQTRALVDFGELSLNRAMGVYGPVGDLSVRDGLYYPSKAPLMSFAAVPVYAVLRSLAGGRPGMVPEIPLVFFSRLLLTVLPTLLSLLLVERFLTQYVTPPIALGVTWTYALGTLAFSYSLLFMSHQATATLLLAAFYVCWKVARGEFSRRWLLGAGLLLGLAVTAEYTSALAAIMIAGYATFTAASLPRERPWSAAQLVAGALPAIVFLGWYHHSCFGGIFETGYRHLADVAYQPWHEGGFLGIKTPTWGAFFGSFFSPLRGLLALSPVLVLGFTGLRHLRRSRCSHTELGALWIFTVVLSLAYLYFTSSFSYESWGWTTGPRHLTGWVPFMLLPAALELEFERRPLMRGILGGLAVASILVTSALTFINYIPDDVSEGVFGLFVPLTNAGYLVPTVLGFFGANAPGSWLVFLLVLLAAGMVITLLVQELTWRPWIGLAAVVLAVVLTHRLSYADNDHDRAARRLLERVWLSRPGRSVVFWSTTGWPRS